MKVKRTTLLLLACLVWSAAGFNILRIGLSATRPIGLRVSGLIPERLIAVFYTGLGGFPLLAGLLFGGHFGKSMLAKSRLQRDENRM